MNASGSGSGAGAGAVTSDARYWAERKRANVRLALVLGAVALVLFALAFWKYRPL